MSNRMLYFLALACALLMFAGGAAASVISLDTCLTSPPGVYASGVANGCHLTVSTDGVTEIGLGAVVNGSLIPPVPGTNTYQIPVGDAGGGLAHWDFLYSLNNQYNGGSAVLQGLNVFFQAKDETTGHAGTAFNPAQFINDNFGYGPSGVDNPVNLAADWGAQNVKNLGLSGFLPGFDPNSLDLYSITIFKAAGGQVVETDKAFFQPVATSPVPEPSTWSLLFLGLVACFGFVRRSRALARQT